MAARLPFARLSFAGLIALPLLLAGCRGADEDTPPLRVDAVGDRAARLLIADAVNAGLTARDSAGLVVPGLAQSWRVSDDGLSIVFRLRPAHFVGGAEVKAADVVASLNRARRGSGKGLFRPRDLDDQLCRPRPLDHARRGDRQRARL